MVVELRFPSSLLKVANGMVDVGKTYQAKQNLFISEVVVKTTTGDNMTKSCCGVFFERLHACLGKCYNIDSPILIVDKNPFFL